MLTATEARNLARDKLADVRRGIDPQAERREQRAEITFGDFAQRYLEHFQHHKRSWQDDQQRLRDHLLDKLGSRKLSEITTQQCERIHTSMKEKRSPATPNRVLALLRHMLNTAVRWKLLADSPAQGIPMFREPPPRDIVLTPDECRRLLDACDAETNVHAAALFKLAMLTGRRVGELLGAKWEHFDPERALLTLPLTKAGERQFVYLSAEALAVLRTLPRIEGNPYIIAGAAEGKPLNFYRPAWLRILKRAGLPHFPPHGLRHNYASLLVAAGAPLETVGHLLGHKSSTTTRRYAHHRPDGLRRAAEMFSDVISLSSERARRTASNQ